MEISDDKLLTLFEDVAGIKKTIGLDMDTIKEMIADVKSDIKDLKKKYDELFACIDTKIVKHETELHINIKESERRANKKDNLKLIITVISVIIAISSVMIAIFKP